MDANAGPRRDTVAVPGHEPCAVLAFYPTFEDDVTWFALVLHPELTAFPGQHLAADVRAFAAGR